MQCDRATLLPRLGHLPADICQQLLDQLYSPQFDGALNCEGSQALTLAPQLLTLAAQFSIAPVSNFHVGSVALGASGTLYLGANMEFIGVPLSASLHAEQSAVLNAKQHGETRIQALAISAAPCGFCRQFLWELPNAAELAIIVEQTQTTLEKLLPMPFGAQRPAGQSLLDSPANALTSEQTPATKASQRVLAAACCSYVPYTGNAEGCTLECANGNHYSGSAAESIAFNPSVPAVASALNQHNLSSGRDHSITAATLATLSNSNSSNSELATTILQNLCQVKIERYHLQRIQY